MKLQIRAAPEQSSATVRAPARRARILLIEGDPGYRAELYCFLTKKIDCLVKEAADEAKGLLLATTWFPNLIMFNPHTSGTAAQHLCHSIRTFPELQFTYLVLLSDEQTGEHTGWTHLDGIDDYLVVPCSQDEVLARVRCGLRVRDLQHKLASRNRCLQNFGLVDASTGLLNSRALTQVLVAEENRARHESKPFAVLLGHVEPSRESLLDDYDSETSEKVMQAVAHILADNVRSTDFVAQRASGEFVVVLPETNHEQARKTAIRLTHLVQQIRLEGRSRRLRIGIKFQEHTVGPREGI